MLPWQAPLTNGYCSLQFITTPLNSRTSKIILQHNRKMKVLTVAVVLGMILTSTNAFTSLTQRTRTGASSHLLHASANSEPFEITVDLPGKGFEAKMKFPPVLDVPSEIVEVRYAVPFGLDVAPKENLAVCTKDGAGGEKVGDVLRYTSQWTLGLPRGDGVITTAMSFAGGIGWQVSMFDVARASRWEDVVAALVSNEASRTDEVVMLFERPLSTEE